MGPALLDLRQRPLPDVPAAHFERLVVRAAPQQKVDLSSRTPEGARRLGVVGSVLGHRDPLLYGVNHRVWNMTTSPPLTLSALLPGFTAYLSSERRFSAGTVSKYRENILWITRHRGDPAVADIDFQWIVNIKSHLLSNGAGPSRVAGITYALKNALVFARDVLSVPVMNVELIRAPGAPRRQVVYLTPDEYNDFTEAIPLYTGFGRQRLSQLCFRALVETLAATGMRISEALSLNVESVDLSKGEALVIGKGNKQRTVFFTERAITWIKRYLALRNDTNQPLFTGTNGRRMLVTCVHAMFERTNAKVLGHSGKRVTPHILRHTAATTLLQRGCPVGHIKEILGHQNLETTCRFYLGQLTKAEVRKAFDAYMHYEVPISEAPQPPAVG
jgi:site-specific recombinase XerD